MNQLPVKSFSILQRSEDFRSFDQSLFPVIWWKFQDEALDVLLLRHL